MPKRYTDAVLELDSDRRGSSALSRRRAVLDDIDRVLDRAHTRAGQRDLDQRVEMLPGLSRMRRDKERINPRATVAPAQHPRMLRELPAADQVRVPFSSRQKKARSKTRREVQAQMPTSTFRAYKRMLSEPGRWRRINDALSAAVGDIQALDEADQAEVRRIDRAIQTYERANGRGHVIYTNVVMPRMVNHTSLRPFVERYYQPGDVVEFDRYTVGEHQLHEASRYAGPEASERVAVFEIATRRGQYVGQSDSLDNTAHLLPRGMRLQVVGTHEATYQAPDGTTGTRMVIQVRDITEAEG